MSANPTLSSTYPSTWSNDNTVDVTWTGAGQAGRCVAPRLTGLTLKRSRVLIARAGRLGRVTRMRSARVKQGRVVKQRPRSGLRLRRGARIAVTVSRGRR